MNSLLKQTTLVGLALLAPMVVLAESGTSIKEIPDEWQFTLAFPMLWTPDISGKIRGGERADFEIEFEEILEDLKFGLMGEIYANKGRFGIVYRGNYLNVSDDAATSDTLVDLDLEMDMVVALNDLLVSWRVHDNVRLQTGVRHVYSKIDLDVKSKLGGTVVIDDEINIADDHQFDYLVGINFDHWFNDKWGVMLNGDVAVAGDNDRDYSLDLTALYRINDRHNFWFGYRYLNIGTDSDESGITTEVDIVQKGPKLGWAFTF